MINSGITIEAADLARPINSLKVGTSKMYDKVTVLLTVFRRLDYLEAALTSALNQDHPDVEILLIDDSGESAAESVCGPYIASGRIKYLPNAQNMGIVASLSVGIELARGRFIAILNDDDLWEPTFLSRLTSVLERRPNCNLVFCDHYIIDHDGTVDMELTTVNSIQYGRSKLIEGPIQDPVDFAILKNGVPLAMAAMFRRSALDFKKILVKEVSGAYDYWIAANLAVSGEVYYVDQRLTRYRIHPAMETARQSTDKNENLVYINQALLKRQEYAAIHPLLRRRLSAAYAVVGRDCLLFGCRRAAARNFMASLATRWNLKAAACVLLCWLPVAWGQMAARKAKPGAR